MPLKKPLKESKEFKIGAKLAAASVGLAAFWLMYATIITLEDWDALTSVLVILGVIVVGLLMFVTFGVILIWLAIAFNKEKELRKWAKDHG